MHGRWRGTCDDIVGAELAHGRREQDVFPMFDASILTQRLNNERGAGAAGDCLRDTARVPERELAPVAPDLAAEDADMPSADVDCKLSSPVRATFLLGGFIVRSELPEPLSLSLLLREVGLHAASGLLQTPVDRRDAADEGRRETRLQTESFNS
jgi:hypothetical protein